MRLIEDDLEQSSICKGKSHDKTHLNFYSKINMGKRESLQKIKEGKFPSFLCFA